MANMYEFGWDEPEETKCDKKALQREKWANYEYSDEEQLFITSNFSAVFVVMSSSTT